MQPVADVKERMEVEGFGDDQRVGEDF